MKKLLSLLALLPLAAIGQPFGGGVGPFPKQGYGDSGVTNILVKPNNSFTIGQAGGWNPIVVSGAGSSTYNGSYYQIQTNADGAGQNTHPGYAVWTNGTKYLVLNDTNMVQALPGPGTLFSNLWTIQDAVSSTINYAYDLLSVTPFGTWEVSGLGGTPGSSPVPQVGNLPDLIRVTMAAPTNGILTLSPGLYDIGAYTWFPTNLTVVAYGAVIVSVNPLEGVHPYGTFSLYGGTVSNSFWVPIPGAAFLDSVLFKVDNCQSNLFIRDATLFGSSDTINGTAPENQTIKLIDCDIGTLWDAITYAKAGGTSNVVFTAQGCYFYSKTNQVSGLGPVSTANVMVSAGVNQVRIVGCTMQAGPGFTTGGGISQTTANTTNEVSGTVINLSASAGGTVFKIKQTAGTMIVPFGDFNLSDVNGTITWKGYSSVTNFTAYAAGTAYTLTGSSAALTFGTTQPLVTINQAGTYLIQGYVGLKYVGTTYAGAQTLTLKFRRTNNTAADLTNGSRAMEMPVLTTFTGGDVFGMPPVIYTATSGDTVTIFGILSATPSAGSVTADTAEIVAVRLY